MSQRKPYRSFLQKLVKQRKYLIATGRCRKILKNEKRMRTIIECSEELLNKFPTEEHVRHFIKRYAHHIKYLVPATDPTDKRIQFIDQL